VNITGFFVAAPSRVQVNESFDLGIKALCAPRFVGAECFTSLPGVLGRYNISPRGISYMDNVPPAWKGSVEIEGGEGYHGPTQVSFAEGSGPYPGDERPIRRIGGLAFATPGVKFISVREPDTGIAGRCNPVEVVQREPDERLFWGDIHSQTFFSDGLRCPEELYAFARHEAFLDIFALADHSESLTDRQWEYFVAVTNDADDPGRFATLVGFEWTSHRWGHRNVYFPRSRGPIWRCNDPVMGDLHRLFGAARKHGALVVPHHSANTEMGVDWSLGHDPEVERLVEIYSVWGNSECPAADGNPRPIRAHGGEKAGQHVIDALRRSRRLGFIAGGDIHDGRPGDDLHRFQQQPEQYRLLWPQGIMGVMCKELTREAVFDALWHRQCYATTNIRPLLQFEIDGAPMGSEIQARGQVLIRVKAASEVPLSRIVVVKNGAVLAQQTPNARIIDEQFSDEIADELTWYYARVERADGEMAWSSPIWVRR